MNAELMMAAMERHFERCKTLPPEYKSVGADLPRQIARVQSLAIAYREMGPSSAISAVIMDMAVAEAQAAQSENDPIAIIRAYKVLSEFEEC